MRKLLLIVILIIQSIPLYAEDQITINNTKISISTPQDLPEIVAKTLNTEIQERLPSENVTATARVATVSAVQPTALLTENDTAIDTSNWEHTVTVKKVFSDEKITSLLMTTYEYMGGAHGSTSRIGLVIDNNTGKRLSLEDFYVGKKLSARLSIIWRKQIMNRLEQAIGKKLTADERNWIHDGSNDISNYQSFVITSKMITIYGQEYQHNAYAYGTQTLNYPRYKLTDIAK